MRYQKQFLPDEPSSQPLATPTPKAATPQADMDLLTVAERVRDKWLTMPAITLLWKTSAQFVADVAAFRTHLMEAEGLNASRPSQTYTLNTLDKEIDNAAGEVKVYIQKKWKDAATANYYRFGIVKEGKNYRLPKDRDTRKETFDLMINAINDDGFTDEEYGSDYWATKKTQYIAALEAANTTDGERSGKVASKNEARRTMKKVLIALRDVLRGNYPDTYKEVIRQWGWQKEDY